MPAGSRFYSIRIRKNPAKGAKTKGKLVGELGRFKSKAEAVAQAQILADARVLSKAHSVLVEAVMEPSRFGPPSMPSSPGVRVGNPKKPGLARRAARGAAAFAGRGLSEVVRGQKSNWASAIDVLRLRPDLAVGRTVGEVQRTVQMLTGQKLSKRDVLNIARSLGIPLAGSPARSNPARSTASPWTHPDKNVRAAIKAYWGKRTSPDRWDWARTLLLEEGYDPETFPPPTRRSNPATPAHERPVRTAVRAAKEAMNAGDYNKAGKKLDRAKLLMRGRWDWSDAFRTEMLGDMAAVSVRLIEVQRGNVPVPFPLPPKRGRKNPWANARPTVFGTDKPSPKKTAPAKKNPGTSELGKEIARAIAAGHVLQTSKYTVGPYNTATIRGRYALISDPHGEVVFVDPSPLSVADLFVARAGKAAASRAMAKIRHDTMFPVGSLDQVARRTRRAR